MKQEGQDYQVLEEAVLDAARKYNCHITELKSFAEYPEVIEW
ncbi:hypothetical protein [Alkalihalobacillus sp. BA299]|nr:hypothetical protein [Alkalihalobacillus sp. BA299]